MTVREEFEQRFYPRGIGVQPAVFVDAMFEIYQAGRESMRAEAMKVCEKAAINLLSGRARVNQVDRHVAQVLRDKEAAIKELP